MRRRTLEEVMNAEPSDTEELLRLESRAKKFLLGLHAEYEEHASKRTPTTRDICDAIMQSAQAAVKALREARKPEFKHYVEYLHCVANSGCFTLHETCFSLIQCGMQQSNLPAEVVIFAKKYATELNLIGLQTAIDLAKEYVKLIELTKPYSKLDANINGTFINILAELYQGLKRLTPISDIKMFIQCFDNVKLSIGMHVASTGEPLLLVHMAKLVVADGIEKEAWLGYMAKLLRGLDRLEHHFRTLAQYAQQKLVEKISEEVSHSHMTLN